MFDSIGGEDERQDREDRAPGLLKYGVFGFLIGILSPVMMAVVTAILGTRAYRRGLGWGLGLRLLIVVALSYAGENTWLLGKLY